MTAIGAGNDLSVNCGMFATGMTCSDEQLLMDAEISGMCRRLAAGLEVSAETIAADLIRQIGPQGETYLTQEHTLAHLRGPEYFIPDLAVRGPFVSWQAAGSRDTYALARTRAAGLAALPANRPDSRRQAAIAAALQHAEAAVTKPT
jgi:trimethylamine--corrinoid protein Co-methyltransferase